MKVTIDVTREDIRYADMGSMSNCAVGRAIRRSLPQACDIWAWRDCGRIRHPLNGNAHFITFPTKACRFVSRMCDWRVPKRLRWIFFRPFSFELEIPDCFEAIEPRTIKVEPMIPVGLGE